MIDRGDALPALNLIRFTRYCPVMTESIEIRVEDDEFTSVYGRPDIPMLRDNPDDTVELYDIPNATIPVKYAEQVEAEGGMDWRGVRLTITRDDDGGIQLNAAAANGVFRWELQPAHFADGVDDMELLIGRLIDSDTDNQTATSFA